MSLYDIDVQTIDGRHEYLGSWRKQVLLIVNVASHCGFTPQYTGLETLYREYEKDGFSVLGFPCNQFGRQEPGDETDIQQFCSTTYDVSFPLFAKIAVNGPNEHPLYHHLKSQQGGLLGKRIKWNFTKFLVDRQGEVRKRYAPNVAPEKIAADVAKLLATGKSIG